MRLVGPDALGKAAANAVDLLVGGGIGDHDKRTPASIIDEGPQRTVYRYLDSERRRFAESPSCSCRRWRPRRRAWIFAPAARWPSTCWPPGTRPTWSTTANITFSDRELGLEHWVEEVIPRAARIVSEDAGGQPVALVGWCLGGIMFHRPRGAPHDMGLP